MWGLKSTNFILKMWEKLFTLINTTDCVQAWWVGHLHSGPHPLTSYALRRHLPAFQLPHCAQDRQELLLDSCQFSFSCSEVYCFLLANCSCIRQIFFSSLDASCKLLYDASASPLCLSIPASSFAIWELAVCIPKPLLLVVSVHQSENTWNLVLHPPSWFSQQESPEAQWFSQQGLQLHRACP